ncbi:unnamed protein product [Cuscuta epithymum]|uniref:Serpin domain-containing protein n=1 Tax=Cuscuta epithymum TaxID=186058 RepID=A0AAV0D4M7_9ASTE|nr:unnamed protein product [Cuscuta epithymum]
MSSLTWSKQIPTSFSLPSPLASCWAWPPPAQPAKHAAASSPSSSPTPPRISMLLASMSSPTSLLTPVISAAPVCRRLTAFGWIKLFLLSPPIKNSWKSLMMLFVHQLTFVSRVLEKLGVQFSSGDLDEMVVDAEESLIVSKIIHKCVIDVNEKGTKAGAASLMGCKLGCARSMVEEEKIDFVADHPFAFFIREDVSGLVVFVGTVLNPLL